jgi:hypothetical protein
VTFRYDDEEISLITPDHAKALVGTLLDWAAQEVAAPIA